MNSDPDASPRPHRLHAVLQLWPILLGVLLGLSLGILFAWVVSPLDYIEAKPATLHADFKDQYRALIASAYLATGDLEKARQRLHQLEDEDSVRALTLQAQQALTTGDSSGSVYALAMLAEDLRGPRDNGAPSPPPGVVTPASPVESPSAEVSAIGGERTTPQEMPTPIPSLTPRPTRTPTSTPGAPFILVSQETVCSHPSNEPQLMIEVENAAGEAVPGVELIITWSRGEEHFFTGFKPELGYGYADYSMTPGVIYIISLAGGIPVPNISTPICPGEDGSSYPGDLRLLFRQPR